MLPKTYLSQGNPSATSASFASSENNVFALGIGSQSVKNLVSQSKNLKTAKPLEEIKKILSLGENFALLAPRKNILYAGLVGQMFLLLRRNGQIRVLAAPSEKAMALSGYIEENDEFILCSRASYDILDELDSDAPLENLVKSFSEKIKPIEDQSKLAAFFIKFNKAGDNLVEEPAGNRASSLAMSLAKSGASVISKINLKIMKIVAAGAVILIVGLLIFNFVTNLSRQAQKKLEAESKKIEEIKNNFQNASELLNLNNVRAREVASSALSDIKKIDINSLSSKENKQKVLALIKSLEKLVKDSSGIVKSKATQVYSTTLLKKNSTVSSFAILGEETAILDAKQNLVYFVNLNTKKAQTFEISKYTKSPRLVALSENFIIVFAPDSIVQINLSDNKVQTILKSDSQWKNIVDIELYSDNIYLLDEGASQIWKYLKSGSDYSLIKPYFEGTKPTGISSFAIDMSVYILSGNTVNKYLSGAAEDFALKKVPDNALKSGTKIITSVDMDNIYIWETSQKRIIIFDKKGNYIKQIVDERLGLASSFGIDEKGKTIYFPQGADIYKITF